MKRKTKWLRKCPKCQKILYYSRKYNKEDAIKNQSLCKSCGKTKIFVESLCRQCPKCNKNIIYCTKRCFLNSVKKNQTCRNCSQRNKKIRIVVKQDYRNCSICNRKLFYSSKYELIRADKKNRLCKFCSRKQKNNPMYGKKHTNETKRKIRLKRIKWIQKNKNNNLPIYPIFNKNACKFIDDYGKKNGYKFQHAMNGGEHYISELGYWVDGYDKNKNVVIEIDEKHHFRNGKLRNKDINRQKEIETFLKCKFIRERL